jgi:hypothetical protein
MAAFTKFQVFVEHLAHGVHNFSSDTYADVTVALTATANAPVATNTILGNLTTISPYTNLSSRLVTIASSAHTTGTYKLTLTDLVLTASGGSVAAFQYVVLYNDIVSMWTSPQPVDPLIGWYDYGSALTLAQNETLTLDFDGSAGVLTIQ